MKNEQLNIYKSRHTFSKKRLSWVMPFLISMFISFKTYAVPLLFVEINPNPIEPSELLDAQITISNPTNNTTGLLSLQVLWPEHINRSPVITAEGSCPAPYCDAGEYMFWSTADLGSLPPGGNFVVAFSETISSTAPDGTIIPFEIELFESGTLVRTISHSVTVQSNSPLELTVDPLQDPVIPGDTLIYEINYSNTGNSIATDTVLTFPVPDGSSFVSATGNGVESGGVVSWSVNDLNTFTDGSERVEVLVSGSLSNGDVLLVDSANISATISSLYHETSAMATSQIHASRLIKLNVEINPDPIQPSELLDAQITVSNPTNNTTGLLSLQVLWPEHINRSPVITADGSCPAPYCDAGEYMFWSTADLGSLPPGGNFVVAFSETISSTAPDGTIIPFEIELFESGTLVRTISHSVTVQSNSPLELTVDPLQDPVIPGDTLIYEINYSNTGNSIATDTVLTFPVPDGSSFVSATGNGVESGGVVSWSVNDLNTFTDGSERVEVLVSGSLSNGDVLLVDSANISGTIFFLTQQANAMATSQIHASRLIKLNVEINPDPIQPSELLDAQITISNPTVGFTGDLTLRLLWPEHINRSPVITADGSCPAPYCDAGEYMFWSTADLGSLPPGGNFVVAFSETIYSTVPDGTIIPFEIELFESGTLVRTISHSVTVQSNSPLELTVDPLQDPVIPGDTLIYEINYSNTGNSIATDTVLTFPVPDGSSFVSATGNGVESGGVVSWSINDLNTFTDGSERVEVLVSGSLSNGDVLLVDSANISATISSLYHETSAMATSQIHASRLIKLNVEINPDPIQPSELLDAQITISNPTVGFTGDLTLRLLWPEHINRSPVITADGSCPAPYCDAGEYMFWSTADLGSLPPGGNFVVAFSETISSTAPDGTIIPFEIELFESGTLVRTISHSVTVQSNSPLELTVDPLQDPVIPGEVLLYEITYGNTGGSISNNTTLIFPIPNGSSFISATGNGIEADGLVSWEIGDLNGAEGFGELVTVLVDSNLQNGSVLIVNSANLTGTVSLLPQKSIAMAVSQTHTSKPITLELDIGPDPIQPSVLLDAHIRITNPTGSFTGDLSLRLLWPEHINRSPVITAEGSCPAPYCDAGEYVFWSETDLGSLPPNGNFIVSFNETIFSTTPYGTVIPFEVELFEAGVPIRSISRSILVLPPNVAPVAFDDSIIVNQGETVTVLVGGNSSVLTNDTDVDDVNLTANVVTTTINGTLTFSSNGTFSYAHNNSLNLADGFDYQVCDDEMPVPACDTGHVTIQIVDLIFKNGFE